MTEVRGDGSGEYQAFWAKSLLDSFSTRLFRAVIANALGRSGPLAHSMPAELRNDALSEESLGDLLRAGMSVEFIRPPPRWARLVASAEALADAVAVGGVLRRLGELSVGPTAGTGEARDVLLFAPLRSLVRHWRPCTLAVEMCEVAAGSVEATAPFARLDAEDKEHILCTVLCRHFAVADDRAMSSFRAFLSGEATVEEEEELLACLADEGRLVEAISGSGSGVHGLRIRGMLSYLELLREIGAGRRRAMSHSRARAGLLVAWSAEIYAPLAGAVLRRAVWIRRAAQALADGASRVTWREARKAGVRLSARAESAMRDAVIADILGPLGDFGDDSTGGGASAGGVPPPERPTEFRERMEAALSHQEERAESLVDLHLHAGRREWE